MIFGGLGTVSSAFEGGVDARRTDRDVLLVP